MTSRIPAILLRLLTVLAVGGALGVAATAPNTPTRPSGNPTADPSIFRQDNLAAWCIVPFDRSKRGPEERAKMLEAVGLKKFVYDYRAEHVPQWDEELAALRKHGIELLGWWFPGSLSPDALKALELFERHNVRPQLWVSGGGGSLRAASLEEQASRVQQEVRRLSPILEAAAKRGLMVGLYNHGGWFGEPDNQIEIINSLKASGLKNVGIVYNQHHGHGHIEGFEALIKRMLPHLICLNLNGMDPGGDRVGRKILPLAAGSEDTRLLRIIRKSGYSGPIGILNHTSEDAEARLLDNLDGLRAVLNAIEKNATPERPVYRSWRESPGQAAVPPPAQIGAGTHSLSSAFGKALQGPFFTAGGPQFRSLPLTVECRAKLTQKERFNILVACDPKASSDHWELYTYMKSGFISLFVPGRGGNLVAPVDVCDGQWHSFAAVIEVERARLYVDGKMVKEGSLAPAKGTPVPGGLAIGSLVERSIRCDGVIDDVRISSGVRAPAQPSDPPLQKDDTTLGIWSFEDLPESGAGITREVAHRGAQPATLTIPAAKPEQLTPTNGWSQRGAGSDWARSLGGGASNRFSELTQINPSNVGGLREVWTYRSKDAAGNIQCNPVVVGGTLFVPTPGRNVVAVDAATGLEKWRFSAGSFTEDTRSVPARRGLVYWRGDAVNAPRLLFGHGDWLIALDAGTGTPVETFGRGGKVRVPTGTTVAGAVFDEVFVIAGYQADVFGFDIRSGRELWRFKTRPGAGENGSETWTGGSGGGANCWGGMAMDESRGIAFVSTGSPKPNFFGMGHKGDNLFSDCVIALDARTGLKLWHFQEVRHDIWDWDIPAPPNLVTVERHGKKVDAVAQVTKLGNTLLLDRVTGEPLYDFRLVRADGHGLPGDETAPYQPLPELPEPFARQAYTMADVPADPAIRDFLLPTLQRANIGLFPSMDEARPTVMFNIHGGAEWTGAAADARGFLYVTSNEIPWSITTFRDDDPAPISPPTAGEQAYQQHCAACHAPDRRGVGHAPPLRGLRHRLAEDGIRALLKNGRSAMPPMAHLTEAQIASIIDFVLCRDRGHQPSPSKLSGAWTFSGFKKLLDPNSYPGCTPPWGRLVCMNLNTGKIEWAVPFGEYAELTAKGMPPTGQENFGGASVTASGLVFATGTRDGKIRAYDALSGRELWSHLLPFTGTAAPTIYEVGGREFVVVTATGGGKLATPAGDAWVAFALPR